MLHGAIKQATERWEEERERETRKVSNPTKDDGWSLEENSVHVVMLDLD